MAMVASNMSGHIQKQLTRSLERILEEAHLSGELKLSGRKLKEFPKTGVKYNLCDTVTADLSKNRFAELPEEVTEYPFLEKLQLYHNAIRVIPDTVVMLQSLAYLDLSRNQLTTLPREVCRLPLQTLLVAHNRLVSLPEELGRMSALAELDAGCNEISTLPPRIGDLPRLRSLDLRSNLLVQLPIELTYLRLVKLDISGNRISVLPNELRKMKSLIDLNLTENPLTSPPASLCARGRIHIFKYLERQAAKHERARGGRARRGPLEARGHATLDTRPHRRHNVDSGYSTSDGVDKRWSQEINSGVHEGDIRGTWRQECSPLSIALPARDAGINGSCSGTSTPSTISPGEHTSLEDELGKVGKAMILHDQLEKRRLDTSVPENVGDPRRLTSAHCPISTNAPREYKEALRQQRVNEGPSVYRLREQVMPPGNESNNESQSNESDAAIHTKDNSQTNKQIFTEENSLKRPVQKVTPSRINYQNSGIFNGSSNNEYNNKNGKPMEQAYRKPNSPVKSSSGISSMNSSPSHTPRLVKTAMGYVDGNKSPNRNNGSPKAARSVTWNSNMPEKYSFTMRREFERAKEEADLIEQLRNHIETRLKMALPEELAPALTDGVVLCHLANHVRPRSVASIHVPSPAVPKLTMARCRRNVDNFLEACRKIGVDEEVLLDGEAIMDVGYMDAYGLEALGRLVSSLVEFEGSKEPAGSSRTIQDHVLSAMLFATFITTLMLLYVFPLPE
ncbi:leucine-rich repeat and calponin homology domain-containing protein isoform X4 [Athalia rosae]|uniref:leucine-rich repeat and calponin homology domain-containing protein isoform X4 n=1 Tax=Athalia rosae TaxID=37344 RepID=UPI0006251307|nr:leucine-rich repeat and calponin homology domain-containing protein isoform X4 [Athalia rosae]